MNSISYSSNRSSFDQIEFADFKRDDEKTKPFIEKHPYTVLSDEDRSWVATPPRVAIANMASMLRIEADELNRDADFRAKTIDQMRKQLAHYGVHMPATATCDDLLRECIKLLTDTNYLDSLRAAGKLGPILLPQVPLTAEQREEAYLKIMAPPREYFDRIHEAEDRNKELLRKIEIMNAELRVNIETTHELMSQRGCLCRRLRDRCYQIGGRMMACVRDMFHY